MNNQVQLITYPDSLGGNLETLQLVIERYLPDLFGGVHILPPYPSSADRGFAPTDYFKIDPRFGSWAEIRSLGKMTELTLDLMVNHISRQSAYFQDFKKSGRRSPYADMFITLDKIWPNGEPLPQDVARIFLRKPNHPFSDVKIESTGQIERLWTTFGSADWSEQVDLDVHSRLTRSLFIEILQFLHSQNLHLVRLDAVAFVIKKPGTSCFFVEPEIYEFLEWMRVEASAHEIELLLEVHADQSIQHKLASRGYRVYDFVLPALVLHTLFSKNSQALKHYLKTCPRLQVTTLDTHDGIPIQPDLDSILGIEEAQEVVNTCLERGANLSRILSTTHQARAGFDAHQVNITYYSALGKKDEAYLTARAIQFFAPGIPQVYYVGLLAGENDEAAVNATGERRAINRHNFTLAEIKTDSQKRVVRRLMELIRFRNQHQAFAGEFQVIESGDQSLRLEWKNASDWCRLTVDLQNPRFTIEHS